MQSKLTPWIKTISASGTAVISFSTSIIVPSNMTSIDNTVLQIRIKPGRESLPEDVAI
jgi:hypothetical protein